MIAGSEHIEEWMWLRRGEPTPNVSHSHPEDRRGGSGSVHDKLRRVRKPRVHITYDVEHPRYRPGRMRTIVGFIDIMGFTERVKGLPPEDLVNYLRPFHSNMIDAVVKSGGAIDKTIGDEVMFFKPTFEESEQPERPRDCASIAELAATTIREVSQRAARLGAAYPTSVGLAYGDTLLEVFGTPEHREITVVGEVVNLAKRVQSLKPVMLIDGFACCVAVLAGDLAARSVFEVMHRRNPPISRDAIWNVYPESVTLRGISPSLCARILPEKVQGGQEG